MKKNKKECDLKGCSFCTLCLREWLPAIAAHRQTFQVRKGEMLFKEGEKVTGIFFVYKGAVKVHKKWGEKELIIRLAGKGEIVGHRGLGNELDYPVSATAISTSLVCFVGIEFFFSSLKMNQDYFLQLMMFFAEELKVSERQSRPYACQRSRGAGFIDHSRKIWRSGRNY